MGDKFRALLPEASLTERMQGMAEILTHRRIPTNMNNGLGLPVLEVQACPYPDLVVNDHDRSVCNLEKKVMSAALGHEMELSQCRLDGHSCCQFKPIPSSMPSG
jgi:predicted ArsR family transcriptional regulator